MTDTEFSWTERMLFLAVAASSLAIVIYFARKQSSSLSDFVWGGGKLGSLPLSMSIVATSISSISFSVANDIYQYGPHVNMDVIGIILMGIFCWIQIPVLYPLKLVSLNEYASLRFDGKIKFLVSISVLISMVIYTTIATYSVALFISQLSNFGQWTWYYLILIVCYFLTSIGGFKGVVWSDTLQAFAILISTVVLTVFGVMEAGGIGAVFRDAKDGDRLSFDWSFDLTKRLTVWTALCISTMQRITMNSLFSPGIYQRYAAHRNQSEAYKTVVIHTTGMVIIVSLTYFLGYVMYSVFKGCDPVLSGKARKYDQVLPYFIQYIGRKATIARSVYIIGFISAGISTLTTIMNTFAVTLYKDFIHHRFNKGDDNVRGKRLIQLAGLANVIICVALAQIVENMGSIVDLTILLLVPALFQSSVIFMGIFFPWVTSKGALWGCLTGTLFTTWIIIGHKTAFTQGLIAYETKKMSVQQCVNVTAVQNLNTTTEFQSEDTFFLFKVTPFFHATLGFLTMILCTLIVTSLTGTNDLTTLDRRLISPLLHKFLPETKNKMRDPLQRALNDVSNV